MSRLKDHKLVLDKYTSALARIYKTMRLAEQAKTVPISQLAKPEIYNLEPWDHQRRAYVYGMMMPLAMFDMGMGTGKTKVMIDITQNRGDRRVLVVCPIKVVDDVWARQVPEHAKVPVEAAYLTSDLTIKQRKELAASVINREANINLIVTNYEAVWREPLRSWILEQEWDAIWLDESHRIKGAGSKVSKFLYRLGQVQFVKKYCMTGTMLANSPMDGFAQYRFLDSGIFGTALSRFQSRYAIMGGKSGFEIRGWKNKEEMSKKIASISIRVESDVIKLPEPVEVTRTTRLEPEARRIFKELDKEMIAEVAGGEVTVSNALSKFTRLYQIGCGYLPGADGALMTVSTARVELLEDILTDIDRREPIVIYYRFKADAVNIRQVCKNTNRQMVEVSGRVDQLKLWKAGKVPVVAVQIAAGAEGLDLTRAKYCIYYSLDLSLYKYEQSYKRIHRPGQTNNVVFIHISVRGTLDAKVWRALRDKKDVVTEIYEAYRRGEGSWE
jgi:SNF2 family DNA or RNA helicase